MRKSEEELKSVLTGFKTTQKQRAKLENLAWKKHMNISEYIMYRLDLHA